MPQEQDAIDRTRRFIFMSTEDQATAQKMAEHLGSRWGQTPPRVAFSAQWTMRQQKAHAPLAALAARFCGDEQTLSNITRLLTPSPKFLGSK